ncbi:MAG: hypothetical protein P8M61_01350 [Crocinitomicaceae bacterium]|nr:hypothetical protein [Crocinitomicaceae bacterium]MDG2463709.1 hypothetical protein [Crocinitomicaceae bacterium]
MKKWFYKFLVYTALILGYLFLYVLNVEEFIYDQKDIQVKSTVDFVYQQF